MFKKVKKIIGFLELKFFLIDNIKVEFFYEGILSNFDIKFLIIKVGKIVYEGFVLFLNGRKVIGLVILKILFYKDIFVIFKYLGDFLVF